MIIHFNSEEHARNDNPACTPCEAFNKRLYPLPKTTVVLWDLNTCPVPPGYDIACVRPSIKSALKTLVGNLPVTVFAIGNLDGFSGRALKDISSSGILLIHTPFDDGSLEVSDVLDEWRRRDPSRRKRNYNVFLISGNASWCSHLLLRHGHTTLRAFPNCKPAETYGSYKEWQWEELLQENLSEANSQILEDKCIETGEPAWFCRLCEIPSESFDGFIEHLKSKRHGEELWEIVPRDDDDKPIFFCKLCNYPAYKPANMTLHLNSEQHAHNLVKQKQDEEKEDLNNAKKT
ncbi:unnamed protein product [Thlaspi arvense]|uniref:NYN domain-containing protein n=1 Tax=Thlaspi arvense TaxID=13288 RepID=A0AAU9TBU0_THLAR|nr:unnamed protein product [Thlaspi arvense]